MNWLVTGLEELGNLALGNLSVLKGNPTELRFIGNKLRLSIVILITDLK